MLTICCLGYCDDSQWALTRRATRNGLRNARLLAVGLSSGTLRAVRVSKPKFRRDETGYSQPEACHAMPTSRFTPSIFFSRSGGVVIGVFFD